MDVPKELGKLTPEQEVLFKKLTKLQKSFVAYYLSGHNATESHKLAGGRSNNEKNRPTIAHNMLHQPNTKAFVDSFQQHVVEQVQGNSIMSRKEMAERLTTMANATVHDIGTVHSIEIEDKDGNKHVQHFFTMKNMEEMTEAGKVALSGYSVTKSGLLIPQMHDQKSAMKQLAELMGYNREVDGEDAKLTQEERILNMISQNAVTDERLD